MTDPRIHERRVLVAREKGRRRRRVLAGVLVLAALAGGGLALVHSSLFGARHVEVTGSPHVARSEVVAVAGLAGAPPLVDLSPAAIARRLERLPWVETASVSLSWPTTVRIAVVARTPVAALRAGGGWAVVDPTGRVLEDVASRPSSLPVVSAGDVPVPPPGGSLPRSVAALARVAAVMPESMVPEVTAVTLGRGGIVLQLADNMRALLGNTSLLRDKFVALKTVLVRADLSGISVIDLQVPSAPVLLH